MSQILELRIPEKNILNKKIEDILVNLWYRLNSQGGYIFYEETDFLSFGAIRISICDYKQWKKITSSSGGLRNKFDIDKQNETIRALKKKFWWYIYNDWRNWAYISWWEDNNYTIIERSCGLAYHKFKFNYIRARSMATGIEDLDENIPLVMLQIVPSSNFWNLIVPFLVSMVEDFLKTFFTRYLEYSEKINLYNWEKIEKHFSIWELTKISKREMIISEIIASRYNFQNIPDIKKAYKNYLKINIEWIWKDNIWVLEEIIQKRHMIIHEAEFYLLTKEQIWKYIECIHLIWESLVTFIEKQDQIRLDLDK